MFVNIGLPGRDLMFSVNNWPNENLGNGSKSNAKHSLTYFVPFVSVPLIELDVCGEPEAMTNRADL